jgi:hypothetical protein
MTPCPMTEVVSVLKRFVELPQLAVLEMKAFVGAQQTWLRQSIADGCKVVAPDACSLLALKESRLHEEVPAND